MKAAKGNAARAKDANEDRKRSDVTRHNDASRIAQLFIYGTLKRGHCRAPILAEQRFLRTVQTRPIYRMLNCGTYPGLVATGTGDGKAIQGELWEVDRVCLALLDSEEGVDVGLYKRAAIEVEGHPRRVEGYHYLHDISSLADCGNCWTLEFERGMLGR